MGPVEPESCGSKEGKIQEWNGVKECEWIPEENGAASVAGTGMWMGLGMLMLMLIAPAVRF
jgi:hypothetical protein